LQIIFVILKLILQFLQLIIFEWVWFRLSFVKARKYGRYVFEVVKKIVVFLRRLYVFLRVFETFLRFLNEKIFLKFETKIVSSLLYQQTSQTLPAEQLSNVQR